MIIARKQVQNCISKKTTFSENTRGEITSYETKIVASHSVWQAQCSFTTENGPCSKNQSRHKLRKKEIEMKKPKSILSEILLITLDTGDSN